MYKILYNARNQSKRRFMFNLIDMNFDVTVNSDNYNKTIEWLDSFDLIVNDRHLSRLSSETLLNSINPDKIINGSLVSSKKTFAGEVFEKHFGKDENSEVIGK